MHTTGRDIDKQIDRQRNRQISIEETDRKRENRGASAEVHGRARANSGNEGSGEDGRRTTQRRMK